MARTAVPHFSRRYARYANPRPFLAPDRAVTAPHRFRGAGEAIASGNNGNSEEERA